MGDINYNLRKHYRALRRRRIIDTSFAAVGDVELTDEEIAEIDNYWGKYKFAYPEIDYKSFKTFKNRCGKFDVRHCPGVIRTAFFAPYFNPPQFRTVFQHKCYLPLLFPDVKQPVMLAFQMNGLLYNAGYVPIDKQAALDILMYVLGQGKEIIFKCSFMGGGRGVYFASQNNSRQDVEKIMDDIGLRAYVVQEVMEQSKFTSALNKDSVNTIRVTTLLHKGSVRILAALLRVGKPGSRLDNFAQGGSLIGVNPENGECNRWALTKENERITVLPNGVDLDFTKLAVPNFSEVKEMVTKMHYRIPYIKMISWDIALYVDNSPVLIENNFAGEIQLHEAVTGPIFGDLMDEFLDEYLRRRFYVEITGINWVCKEFSSEVKLDKYIGTGKNVIIQSSLKGKPIRRIDKNAFKGRTDIEASARESFVRSNREAFSNVKLKAR